MRPIFVLLALALAGPALASEVPTDPLTQGTRGAPAETPPTPREAPAPAVVVDAEGRKRRKLSRGEYVREIDRHTERAHVELRKKVGPDFTPRDVARWVEANPPRVRKVLICRFLDSAVRNNRELRFLIDASEVVQTAIRTWVKDLTDAILSGVLWDGSRKEPLLTIEIDGEEPLSVTINREHGAYAVRVHRPADRPASNGGRPGPGHTVVLAVIDVTYAAEEI